VRRTFGRVDRRVERESPAVRERVLDDVPTRIDSRHRDPLARASVDANGPTEADRSPPGDECDESAWDRRLIGRRVGPYRIESIIGRGGMGIVYAGERVIDFERRVAIKVVRADIARPEMIRRFEREREILGRLDHPAIAPLLDGGRLEDGRPYLVMPLIDGERIDHRARRIEADHRRIAGWVLAVARGVEYAHEHQIFHRDLKPGNVLIGPDDQPIVMDFGLAKLLDGNRDDDETRSGMWLGTERFAAPETIGSEIPFVSQRAVDVWGVGTLLYALLARRAPRPSSAERDEANRLPTSRVTPIAEFDATVPKDLAAIAEKCLEPDPHDRYASVADVADDLARFLSGAPISIRPLSPPMRLARWARRSPREASLLSLVLLALIGSAITFASLWSLAERRRVEAEARTAEALRHRGRVREAVDRMYTEVSSWLETTPHGRELRERLLSAAADAYEELGQEESADPIIRSKTGTAYYRLAQIRNRLLDVDGRTRAIDRAIAIFAGLVSENPADDEARFDLFHSYLAAGRYEEAHPHIALLAERHPDDPVYGDCLAASYRMLAEEALARNDLVGARRLTAEGIDVADRVGSPCEPGDSLTRHQGTTRWVAARIHVRSGEIDRAIELLDEADRHLTPLLDAHPAEVSNYLDIALVLKLRAGIAFFRRDAVTLQKTLERLIRFAERLDASHPGDAMERIEYLSALREAATYAWWSGARDEAIAELMRVERLIDETAERIGENRAQQKELRAFREEFEAGRPDATCAKLLEQRRRLAIEVDGATDANELPEGLRESLEVLIAARLAGATDETACAPLPAIPEAPAYWEPLAHLGSIWSLQFALPASDAASREEPDRGPTGAAD